MIAELAQAAIVRAIGRLQDAAAQDLPPDIAVIATDEGLRLTGPDLRRRWLTDVRLRGLSITARLP